MVPRIATHLMLRPEDVPPSREGWEVIGVFNPGAVRHDGEVVLLVRVAEWPTEQRPGWVALPYWSPGEGPDIQWVKEDQVEWVDPRIVRVGAERLVRLTFVSHLRVAVSRDGRTIDGLSGPLFVPESIDEEFGVEDPRITPLDGRYWITYVAVSRHGPVTSLASTTDFESFTRHGIIFCPENKDVVLFPERVDGQYVALHRPVGAAPFAAPEMWLARSPDLVHWGQHQYVYGGQGAWEATRVGAGTPPIAVDEGWLEIYHGNRRGTAKGDVGPYFGAVMLLAKDDPAHVLSTSGGPVFAPEVDFEQEGFLTNVVFPTGVVEEDDRLLVYYGASDKYCAAVEFSQADLLKTLRGYPETAGKSW